MNKDNKENDMKMIRKKLLVAAVHVAMGGRHTHVYIPKPPSVKDIALKQAMDSLLKASPRLGRALKKP